MSANTSLFEGTTIAFAAIELNSTHIYLNSTDISTANTTNFTNVSDYSYTHPYESIRKKLAILRLTLCCFGIALNILSILAVLHIPREMNNHLKLLVNLAISDGLILITVIIQMEIFYIFIEDPNTQYLMMAGRQVFNTFMYATLMSLLSMSVDHYIAIMLPLKYHMYMSNMRNNCMILIGWIISIFVGFLDKIVVYFIKEDGVSVWDAVLTHHFSSELIVLVFMPLVGIIVMLIYMRVYCVVRGLVRSQQSLNTDEAHNYKAIITTFLVIGTFFLCWIPYFIFQAVMFWLVTTHTEFVMQNSAEFYLIQDVLFLVLISNCLCDPIIYAVRLKQVQQGFKRMFNKFFSFFNRVMHRQEFHMLNKASQGRRQTEATIIRDDISRNGTARNSISRRASSLKPVSTVYISDELDVKHDPYELQENLNNNPKTTVSLVHKHDSIDEADTSPDEHDRTNNAEKYKPGNVPTDDCHSINSAGTYMTQTSPLSNKEFWPENETTSLM